LVGVQVKLKDSIVSALRFYKAKETEIAWIDAMLDMSHARVDIGKLFVRKYLVLDITIPSLFPCYFGFAQ
jgi:Cleavage and polyadenylation factor 2 C-terminal